MAIELGWGGLATDVAFLQTPARAAADEGFSDFEQLSVRHGALVPGLTRDKQLARASTLPRNGIRQPLVTIKSPPQNRATI